MIASKRQFLRPRTLRLLAAAVTVALGSATVACGSDADESASGDTAAGDTAREGVTGGPGVDLDTKTITVAALSALSGPGSVIGVPGTEGQRVYFDALNAAGGIDGWTIELEALDTQYDPQLHKQVYNDAADEIALVSQSVGTPTTAAILDDLAADQMLAFPASLASGLAQFPNLVLVGTPYRLDVQNGLQWAVDEQGAQPGSPVAIVHQDDEYGQDALGGYQRAVDELELDSVAELTYARTDTDFTSIVRQLDDEGAEYVWLTTTPSQTGPILAKAAELGFEPVWLLSGPAFDPTLLTRAQLPASLFQNAFVVTSFAAWGEDVPGMAELEVDLAEMAPDQEPSPFVMVGYVQGRLVEQTIRAALDSGDLSREGLLAAAATLEEVDMGGLLPPQSSGTDTADRIPSRESAVFEVDAEAPAGIRRVADNFVSELAADDELGSTDG
jgi:ABC-type branched-subunit amino acid transport system substrate-binding protein